MRPFSLLPATSGLPRPAALLAGVVLSTGALPVPSSGQTPAEGVSRFAIPESPLVLGGPARPGAYVSATGRRAAVFGDETGSLELWSWPLKLVRDLELAFEIPEYDEPLPGRRVATRVEVRPEATTIVYTHATFTVRQHVLVPMGEPGGLILLDVETIRPLAIHVGMRADFGLAWPGSFGGGYIAWLADRKAFLLSQGGVRRHNALVGSPFAEEGTSHPAHDAPMIPSRFTLRFDPGRATRELIPVVFAGGVAPRDSVFAWYDRLLERAGEHWAETASHYAAVREEGLRLRTPDPALDLAFEWSKVNLDQQLVCNPELGCGLVAGFGRAGAGNYRPGFGWYFGGDAAINSFAMDGTGQLALVRRGLEFLARYQREDGKIPHEISHAAPWLPWFTEYPYTWYHGDTTPYWLVACHEYWRASGDEAFLEALWPAIRRAYEWSKGTDTDGDGLMENPAAGAGAIEVGGLGEALHTDVYLAGMWVVALRGVRDMAESRGELGLAREAGTLYRRALASLEEQFWLDDQGIYAFALLRPEGAAAAGSRRAARGDLRVNEALTVWPTTALSFRLLDLSRGSRMMERLSSPDITTDWGVRLLSTRHPLYEPLHYNNGAVWPFMTGFTALAHYRYHRSWAGYDLVRDIARTTYDFALGRHPELMSGAYYRTLDTTVPQQFFATSMLVTPLVRGLLGITPDAPGSALELEPHLPAHWETVAVAGITVGEHRVDADIRRGHGSYTVHLRRRGDGAPLHVRLSPALPLGARITRATVDDADVDIQLEETPHDTHAMIEIPLDGQALVELEFEGGVELIPPPEEVEVGDASHGLRVLSLRRDGRDYVLRLEGLAGTGYRLAVRADGIRQLRGAELEASEGGVHVLGIVVPGGADGRRGYVPVEVRFRD